MSVIVSDGTAIVVPDHFAATESQMRWLTQPRFTGYNPKLDVVAQKGWSQYKKLITPPITLEMRIRGMFNRCYYELADMHSETRRKLRKKLFPFKSDSRCALWFKLAKWGIRI